MEEKEMNTAFLSFETACAAAAERLAEPSLTFRIARRRN